MFDESNTPAVPRYRTTLSVGLIGSLLLWASLPPLGWSWLAWVAPLPWLWLIINRELPGRRSGWSLYFAGFVFWMGTLHWLRLPHWATSIGWVAMSAYLAVYIWAFVVLSRVAVHRLGVSIVVAAPLAWTGLEVVRGYLLGGVSVSSLAHTQYQWLEFIQLAEVIGCYGVGGLMMLVSASIARMLPWAGQRMAMWPLVTGLAALGAAYLYGAANVAEQGSKAATVALIQGTHDTTFEYDPDENRRVMAEYVRLTTQAIEELRKRSGSRFDLVVWPESMFRSPLVTFSEEYRAPEGVEWTKEEIEDRVSQEFAGLAQLTGTPALVGLGREHLTSDGHQRWNSAAFVGRDGKILSVYDKQQLVMFGEYVPFFDLWPALYKLTPLGDGLSRGDGPISQEIGGVRYSPSICFETVVPHLIRNQVRRLREQGAEPDVLVNLTNDGWFWGSSELELHLICGVFRAVEVRKPLVIAANTGISAHIDASGRHVQQGPRRQSTFLIAEVALDERGSFWLEYGGWLEIAYVLPIVGLAAAGLWRRRYSA